MILRDTFISRVCRRTFRKSLNTGSIFEGAYVLKLRFYCRTRRAIEGNASQSVGLMCSRSYPYLSIAPNDYL